MPHPLLPMLLFPVLLMVVSADFVLFIREKEDFVCPKVKKRKVCLLPRH